MYAVLCHVCHVMCALPSVQAKKLALSSIKQKEEASQHTANKPHATTAATAVEQDTTSKSGKVRANGSRSQTKTLQASYA